MITSQYGDIDNKYFAAGVYIQPSKLWMYPSQSSDDLGACPSVCSLLPLPFCLWATYKGFLTWLLLLSVQ